MCHVTRTPLSTSKGQLVADVLNSQHARSDATWRINMKILLYAGTTPLLTNECKDTVNLQGAEAYKLCRHVHSLLY